MSSSTSATETRVDRLNTYADGWIRGDPETILRATSRSFVLDDPNAGRIKRDEFDAYFAELRRIVAEHGGARPGEDFLELSEVVTHEADELLTAWCWWSFPGTSIEGSGLIKVGADGVISERLAYYTPLR